MPLVRRSPCQVCGSLNDATATECSECGLSLRAAGTAPEIDQLLEEFMDVPGAKARKPTAEALDLDKEIVDDILDSLAVREPADQFECPLCATPVSVTANSCPKCGAIFEDAPAEAPGAAPAAAGAPAPTKPAVEARERKGVAVRLTEAEGRFLSRLSGRLMDIVVVGTVAALAAVFLAFGMHSLSAIERNPISIVVFGGVTIGGFATGLALFHVSTSSIAQGDRLVKQGRHEEAIRLYDRSIRTGYRPGSAWASKGVALKRLERFEDAMRCQRTALKLDPENEIAWCNLGDLYFHLGNLDEAIGCYDKAIAARRRYAIAWNNKGAALARAGRFREARACHDKAVALQPKYRAAWLNRGEVLARLGLDAEARASIERARTLAA